MGKRRDPASGELRAATDSGSWLLRTLVANGAIELCQCDAGERYAGLFSGAALAPPVEAIARAAVDQAYRAALHAMMQRAPQAIRILEDAAVRCRLPSGGSDLQLLQLGLDVLQQHFQATDGPIELPLPEWLPALPRGVMSACARLAFERGHDLAPVQRLATDPRMRHVWSELGKRKRNSPGEYVYDPNPLIGGITPEARIQRAFEQIVSRAIGLYSPCEPTTAMSRAELAEWAKSWHERAGQVRRIAAELLQFAAGEHCLHLLASACAPGIAGLMLPGTGIGIGSDGPIFRTLSQVANFCDMLAGLTEQPLNRAIVVERHRLEPRLRSFLASLSRLTSWLYGRPLYGILATIASVLFEEEIRPSAVRSALNDPNSRA